MNTISIFSAFLAGVLSFLSPCVLPLIPGYISFISGVSFKDLKNSKKILVSNTLLFILGFSIVFILLGATATALGSFFLANLKVINRIAGIILILFGVHLLGLLQFSFLNREQRYHFTERSNSPFWSLLVGIAFAFGWSPCIGPMLGSILVLASNQQTIGEGIILLTVYSIGLGIPFLLTALGINKFLELFAKYKKYMPIVEYVAGIMLLVMGLVMLYKGGI